mmetsp:Transcript_15762/g.44109  ORF Transcript_15762/g.44109 Transcript_15762/m.44109 type:complete len:214 (-) Transcript_15762:426-1067(-)
MRQSATALAARQDSLRFLAPVPHGVQYPAMILHALTESNLLSRIYISTLFAWVLLVRDDPIVCIWIQLLPLKLPGCEAIHHVVVRNTLTIIVAVQCGFLCFAEHIAMRPECLVGRLKADVEERFASRLKYALCFSHGLAYVLVLGEAVGAEDHLKGAIFVGPHSIKGITHGHLRKPSIWDGNMVPVHHWLQKLARTAQVGPSESSRRPIGWMI